MRKWMNCPSFLLILALILILYIFMAEVVKKVFYRRMNH